MKDVKELFDLAENGTLNYEQFIELAKQANVKLVDLNEGGYVSKNKYESELDAKAKEIATLSGTISTRDTDLDALKKQLADAGADASKLGELTSQLEALQTKYDTDSKAYKKQLSQQAYEFAVKEFANSKKFSSQAAKRDFIRAMTDKQLKMEGDSILGADDFVKAYTENNNRDAFIEELNEDEFDDIPASIKPQFVGSTPGAEDTHSTDPTGGFFNAFHFTGVRPMPEN